MLPTVFLLSYVTIKNTYGLSVHVQRIKDSVMRLYWSKNVFLKNEETILFGIGVEINVFKSVKGIYPNVPNFLIICFEVVALFHVV